MAPTYLDDIVDAHRQRAARDTRVWRERLASIHYEGPSMLAALADSTTDFIKVIAEVKRRSPSKGWIDENLVAGSLAAKYEAGGASAISVLTDEPHFAGSLEDLVEVRAATSLPILRKDFTVSANDVLDAAEYGAGAVLLIAAALSDEELSLYFDVAHRCGLDALVEVHDDAEARRAVAVGARIIGVNQRDLHSFEVSADRAAAVITSLPSEVIKIAESGFSTLADVERAADAGFDAVLVGESFVRSPDPTELVRSFATVRGRGA